MISLSLKRSLAKANIKCNKIKFNIKMVNLNEVYSSDDLTMAGQRNDFYLTKHKHL